MRAGLRIIPRAAAEIRRTRGARGQPVLEIPTSTLKRASRGPQERPTRRRAIHAGQISIRGAIHRKGSGCTGTRAAFFALIAVQEIPPSAGVLTAQRPHVRYIRRRLARLTHDVLETRTGRWLKTRDTDDKLCACNTRPVAHEKAVAAFELTSIGPEIISGRWDARCTRRVGHVGAVDRKGSSPARERRTPQTFSVLKKEPLVAAELTAHSPFKRPHRQRLVALRAHRIRRLRTGRKAPPIVTRNVQIATLTSAPIEPILTRSTRVLTPAGPHEPASRISTGRTRRVGRRVACRQIRAGRAVRSRTGAASVVGTVVTIQTDVLASADPHKPALWFRAQQAFRVVVCSARGLEISRETYMVRTHGAFRITPKEISIRANVPASVCPIGRACYRRNTTRSTLGVIHAAAFGRIRSRRTAHHRTRGAFGSVQPVAGSAFEGAFRRPVIRTTGRAVQTRQTHCVAKRARGTATRKKTRDTRQKIAKHAYFGHF
jgi:hypothetical protein